MNLFVNKYSKVLFQRFLAHTNKCMILFSTTQPLQFQALSQHFTKHRDMIIFNDLIKQSNNTLDNINYFKIFKLLDSSQSEIKHFDDFFLQVNTTVQNKSDNIRMLLAKVKVKIARKHEECDHLYETIRHLQMALQVLEQSLVPPLLLYYQIYRYYGHIHHKLGNKKQALEALEQSVDMIERYLNHSDDVVTSNENSKSQAKAYNALIELNPEKTVEWLKKANNCWQQYEGNKFDLEEYAQTIAHNARIQYEKSKESGQGYIAFNIYQFSKPQLKEKLNKIKKEYNDKR